MSVSIGVELQFFLTSIMWGIIILVIYDVIRIIRTMTRHGRLLIGVEDLLFWVVSAFLIFRMMYIQNNGTIRAFSIIGMVLGMVIYNQSISGIVVKGISRLLKAIIRYINRVIAFILRPLNWVAKRITWIGLFLTKKIRKFGKFKGKALKKKRKSFKITVKKK